MSKLSAVEALQVIKGELYPGACIRLPVIMDNLRRPVPTHVRGEAAWLFMSTESFRPTLPYDEWLREKLGEELQVESGRTDMRGFTFVTRHPKRASFEEALAYCDALPVGRAIHFSHNVPARTFVRADVCDSLSAVAKATGERATIFSYITRELRSRPGQFEVKDDDNGRTFHVKRISGHPVLASSLSKPYPF